MRRLILTAMLVLAALPATGRAASGTASPAEAKLAPTDDRVQAEAFAALAKDRFRAKEFQRAAKLFMQAYALSHEPALVYNAARAYEEAGMAGDAASLFRLYISLTDDTDGILEARERIKRLEAKSPAVVETSTPTTPTATSATQNTITQEVSFEPTPAPVWPRWTVTGAAAASLAAGVTLVALGKAGTEDANAKLRGDRQAYNEAFGSAQTQWWTGAGLAGAGVGLTGLATWLWLRDAPVAVLPTTNGVNVSCKF